MNLNPFDYPPYFDQRIDRWKIGLLIFLFFLLLLGALFWYQLDPAIEIDWGALQQSYKIHQFLTIV